MESSGIEILVGSSIIGIPELADELGFIILHLSCFPCHEGWMMDSIFFIRPSST